MADLCLVSMPKLGRAKSTIVPHWILWLAGYVEQMGYTVDVVDVKSGVNAPADDRERRRVLDCTIDQVLRSDSPIVGLSAFTEDYRDVMGLAAEIKRRSRVTIVVGGIHATVKPEDFFLLDEPPVDIAVVGDGEMPLCGLIDLEKKRSTAWETVPGLVFKRNGRIVRTPPQSEDSHLDAQPVHPYEKLDMDFYLQPQQFLLRSIYLSGVHIFTSRGCPFGCTFCANRRKKVRYRPLESVIEELRFLRETYHIDGFYIHDDTFTIKDERVIEFCDLLASLKHRFVWGMEGRVNQFSDPVFRALKASGCIQIDFGVESGSQDSLNRMKKGIKVKETEAVFERCRSEHIRTYANILINTPEETEEDVAQTVSLMEHIDATSYGICVTTPYPGTEVYDRYVKPPLDVDEYDLYRDDKTYTSIVDPRFRLAAHTLNIEQLSEALMEGS